MMAADGRWSGTAGRALAAEVVRRLAEGADLGSLGLGRTQGRADLRGLPASGAQVGGPGEIVEIRHVRLTGLDLAGASLASWRLYDCVAQDCRLDGADCQDWRLWRSSVVGCQFASAILRGAAVGTWVDGAGNTWKDVDFSRADFRVGASLGARYVGCDFSDADLSGVRFEQCAFVRCTFAGRLRDVRFDGRGVDVRPPPPPPEEIDFQKARFAEVEFIGFDLTSVALPLDPDLCVIRRYRCSLTRAVDLLADQDTPPSHVLRGILGNRLRQIQVGASTADTGLVNLRDLKAIGGPAVATLADEVLRRAEADCLTDGPA